MAQIVEILLMLYNEYHGCWWPDDARSQVISSHGVDLVILEYFSFNIKGLTYSYFMEQIITKLNSWPMANWRHMTTEIWVNICSGNGLLPSGNKPLPEPMLIYHCILRHSPKSNFTVSTCAITVECRYNAIQYHMMLHTSLPWLSQNI